MSKSIGNLAPDALRVVHPTPTSDLVERRISAAEELAEQVASEEGPSLSGLVAAACCGNTGRSASREEVHECAIAALRNHDAAYTSDSDAHDLELRVLALLAAAALLDDLESSSEAEEEDSGPLLSAELLTEVALEFCTSLNLRDSSGAQRLGRQVDFIHHAARDVVERAARAARDRPPLRKLPAQRRQQNEDDMVFLERVVGSVNSLVDDLGKNYRADREELETLWWAMNVQPASTKDGDSVGLRAWNLALELHEALLFPPPNQAFTLLGRVCGTDREQPILVSQLAGAWNSSNPSPVARRPVERVREEPTVFPLLWVHLRVGEGLSLDSIGSEFGNTTGISWDAEFSMQQVAQQLLLELSASSGT